MALDMCYDCSVVFNTSRPEPRCSSKGVSRHLQAPKTLPPVLILLEVECFSVDDDDIIHAAGPS
jgi:hypothetical protein